MCLQELLWLQVFLHLLRSAEEDQGALSRPYELLVRDASKAPRITEGLMMPMISLAMVFWGEFHDSFRF